MTRGRIIIYTLLLIALAFGTLFVLGYLLTSGYQEIARTVDDDPRLPVIEVGGYRFHGETYGDPTKPVVIVVHGGPGWDYRSLLSLSALADDYFVVFYDQRGSGLSPRVPASQLTLESTFEDLDAIIEHFRGSGQVTLIGHSWGAMLVSAYLGRHPNKVRQAVLAEPGFLNIDMFERAGVHLGPRWEPWFLWFATRTWFESLHISSQDNEARKDYFLGKVASRANPEYYCGGRFPPAADNYWRAGATAMSAIFASVADEKERPAFDFTRGLERFEPKVLLIASECNRLIGVDQQWAQKQYFHDVELRIVLHSGHLMFAEQPKTSVAMVRAYLRESL